MKTPTTRFSDRAEAYARYRPGYPEAVYAVLDERADPALPRQAADIAAGTGIFTEGLLQRRWQVAAVEPNDAMRRVAERRLGGRAGFSSRAGSAESTGLDDACVSLIVAAQAFHWFDGAACAIEWRRVLRPGGLVALVWNERDIEASSFMADYEALLRRRAEDYDSVAHRRWDSDVIRGFFDPAVVERRLFPSCQRLDLDGLRGRLLSASYCPNVGEPGSHEVLEELGALFERHASNGHVTFSYATRLFVGRLGDV